jgi:hypothetical protein
LLYRDLDALRSLVPRDFVYHDHRRAGPGRLDADAYIAWAATLFAASPDAVIEPLYDLAAAPHGRLIVNRSFGTNASGGAFESKHLSIFVPGRCLETFELDDLESARARLDELRPDPLAIPPNAAWRAHVRSVEAHPKRDWDALRSLVSPDFVFEDREKRALVKGGVEMWIENARAIPPGTDDTELELIATAGDRVSIGRSLWRGQLDGGPIEREHLRLTELDADGRTRAVIWFDADDRAAAFEEAWARFAAGEGAGDGGLAAIAAMPRAFNRRDWEVWERSVTEDFVMRDHRLLGLGELSLAEWIASFRAWVELAPDVGIELLRMLRWNRRGAVFVTCARGTHQGGAFEQAAKIEMVLTRGALIERYEMFDAADVERALARFEELGGDTGRSA